MFETISKSQKGILNLCQKTKKKKGQKKNADKIFIFRYLSGPALANIIRTSRQVTGDLGVSRVDRTHGTRIISIFNVGVGVSHLGGNELKDFSSVKRKEKIMSITLDLKKKKRTKKLKRQRKETKKKKMKNLSALFPL